MSQMQVSVIRQAQLSGREEFGRVCSSQATSPFFNNIKLMISRSKVILIIFIRYSACVEQILLLKFNTLF